VSIKLVPSQKNGRRVRARHLIVCFILTAVGGFLAWLNYGSILWRMPSWKKRVQSAALRTFGDAWDRESRKLSGPAATDCGRVPIHGDPKAANQCVVKAFAENKPFRVRYDLQGIDSNVSDGLVYTPNRQLYGLVFDGDPAGQGGTSWERERAGRVACPQPFQLYTNPSGRLSCLK
jgi:hypothetical protein